MKILRKPLLAIAIAISVAIPASAGIDADLNGMFDELTNVSSPTAHMGARRGVITGGSIYQRVPNMNTNLYRVQGPRLDVGPCGDLDMTAGSFSFISKDEFVQLIRNIAANAKGYAFKIALNSICPSCEATVEKLREAVQKMNIASLDSCQFAQGLVNKANPSSLDLSLYSESAMNSTITNIGEAADKFSTTFDKAISASGKGSANSKAEAERNGVIGNAVFSALNKQRIDNWRRFANVAGPNYYAQVMSMTGTVIVRPAATSDPEQQGADGSAQGLPEVINVEPTLTFEDLFEGSSDQNDMRQPGKRKLRVYKCGPLDLTNTTYNPALSCIGVATNGNNTALETEEVEIVGFRSRVQDILLGSKSAGDTGLVGKLSPPASLPLDEDEKALIELRPDFATQLRNLVVKSPGAGIQFAEHVTDAIALQLLQTYTDEMYLAATTAVSNTQTPMSAAGVDRIRKTREDADRIRANIAGKVRTINDISQIYTAYLGSTDRNMRPMSSPTPAALGSNTQAAATP